MVEDVYMYLFLAASKSSFLCLRGFVTPQLSDSLHGKAWTCPSAYNAQSPVNDIHLLCFDHYGLRFLCSVLSGTFKQGTKVCAF